MEKDWKTWFLALVGLTLVQGTSVWKKNAKKYRKGRDAPYIFWNHFDQTSIKNRFKKSSKQRSPKSMQFDAKALPKASRNRCQKSSTINAKTGNGKEQKNHQQSCFSEW